MKFIKGIFVSTIALTAFTGLEFIKFHENPNVVYADSKDSVKNTSQYEGDIKEGDQIILKFKSEVNFPYTDGLEAQIKNEGSDPELEKVFSEFPQLTLKRLFTSVNPKEIENIDKDTRETEKKSSSNLLDYYIVEVPNKVTAETLMDKFKKSHLVEEVYMQEKPTLLPEIQLPTVSLNPYDDPRFLNQGYLKEAPYGINASYAWSIKGGDGKGTTFVDMEYGWLLDHEDLLNQKIELISGRNIDQHVGHGTSVLGIVSAEDNKVGNIGIAPKAKVKVVSQIRGDGSYNTADAIINAVHNLQAGDILLLEAQASYDGYGDKYLPVEVQPAIFDAIRAGTDKGIIVIEAGANGSNDLDQFRDRNGKQVLNRNSPDFKDSGAIMIGAASSTVPHKRLWFSNYGSRIDVYGWGENVDTTRAEPNRITKNLYTTGFSGTSSASPIIAGAATSIQGVAKEHLGRPYKPAELRTILSNPNTGTKSQNPLTDKIGVLPDLKSVLSNLGYSPDISNNANVLEGNQFVWSMKGIGDFEFAKLDFNKTKEEMQIQLKAGVPHHYFDSTYASVKVQNPSGKVVYNKDIYGNRQQNAETQKIQVKVGDYIEFTHLEGGNRATLINVDKNIQESFGKKIVYQVTVNGLKIVDQISSPNPDIEAPTQPQGLQATNITANSVELKWNSSTDNVGVKEYQVLRDGKFIQTVQGTTFTDSKLTANIEYKYTVKAIDAAGNQSIQSSVLSIKTKEQNTSYEKWDPRKAYTKGDRVEYQGKIYEAVQSYQGNGDSNWLFSLSLWKTISIS
ncbi:putative mucin/carbohydrate-binding domain-containing protein [Bacillus sp. FSL R9-9492]|uniref:putative mucin/carbohydrate-binding domain-containing protein n=1 Tax=Bacillus sp. FSL R9-9492 TaxID=2921592 RepID=UPI0030FCA845